MTKGQFIEFVGSYQDAKSYLGQNSYEEIDLQGQVLSPGLITILGAL